MRRIPLYDLVEKVSARVEDRPAEPDHKGTDNVASLEKLAKVMAEPGGVLSKDLGRCCENGYFGQTHECLKYPAELERSDEKQLAEYLHIRYEKHAHHEGCNTRASMKVSFDDLPEANKRTMLLLARDVQVLLTRAKQETLKEFQDDARSVISMLGMLEDNTDRQKMINFIREYMLKEQP